MFSIARGSAEASELKPIFDAFNLAGKVPADFEQARYRGFDRKAMAAAEDALKHMKQTWETMLSQPGGVSEHLGQFKQGLSHFRDAADELGVDGLNNLVEAWVGVVKQLGQDAGPVSETVGVEVATSLLFVEQLMSFGLKDFEDLPGRSSELARRIDATLHGGAVDEETPLWLRRLTAAVQERLTIAAFTAETQSGLREAESILDNYFREPDQGREALSTAQANFGQVSGVMKLLGHDHAAAAAAYLAEQTGQMAAGVNLDAQVLPALAGSVGTLGFFLDAIKSSTGLLDTFRFDPATGVFEQQVLPVQAAPAVEASTPLAPTPSLEQLEVPVEPAPEIVEPAQDSAETVLERHLVALDSALCAWADAPDDRSQALSVSELLQNVCDGAQLTEAAELLQNAQASLDIAGAGGASAAIEVATRLGRPASLCTLSVPAAEAAVLPEAEEDIDEELLEIFLAEAAEVLEAIDEAQGQLEAAPGDQMTLTTVRRGFHTLKGSSRMVGLDAFGEAAWSLEQVLNTWLAEDKRADDDLLRLIRQAGSVFSQWVASLEPNATRSTRPDPTLLVARAEAIRAGQSFDSVAEPAQPEAPVRPGSSLLQAETEEADETAADVETVTATTPIEAVAMAGESTVGEAPVGDAPVALDDSAQELPSIPAPAITAFAAASVAGDSGLTLERGSADLDVAPQSFEPTLEPDESIELTAPEDADENLDFDFALDVESGHEAPDEAGLSMASADGVESASVPELALPSGFADEIVDAGSDDSSDDIADDIAEVAFEDCSLEAPLAEATPDLPEEVEPEAIAQDVEQGVEASTAQASDESVDADAPTAEIVAAPMDVESEPEAAPDEMITVGSLQISRPLFEVFGEEARQLEKILVPDARAWVADPSRNATELARRAMHSLKGSAALVQVEPVRAMASPLEQFLSIQIGSSLPASEHDASQYAHLVDVLFGALKEFTQGRVPDDCLEAIAGCEKLLAHWQELTRQSAPASDVKQVVADVDGQGEDDGEPGIQDEFDEELLPLFVEEAEEYLPQIDENLRAWLKAPGDTQLQQLIMRQLHTVKGSARMAGAMVLGQRVHDMETSVEAAMNLDEVPVQLIEELLAEQDIVSEQFEYIRDPSLKPTAPAPAKAEAATAEPAAAAGASTPVSAAGQPAAAQDSARAQFANPLVRVRSELLDKLVNEAGEVSIARSRLDNSIGGLRSSMNELAENVNRLRAHVRELEMQGEMRIQASSGNHQVSADEGDENFDPLEFDRFTRFQELTRMMSESVNDVGTVQANATRAIEEAMADLNRQGQTVRQLQHNLMGIRMVQFGTISDRLYRVVRQVAKQLGKRVSLDIRGVTVQMDRGVLEKMVAPLEHLLRNAISHGIEAPEVRVAAGKAETGDIRLEVMQDGNETMIMLSDDGGGLDLVKIRARAVERGLMGADEAPTDSRLADLIFTPGFSTARTVDQISGRGVGMDVVRSEVSLLGGRVQVNSEPTKGTRFSVILPLTMAIEQVMMVSVGECCYAVPSASVEQVLQLDPEHLAAAYAERSVLWQDEKIPLYNLASLVHAEQQQPAAQHVAPVIILRSAGQRIAVHADEVSKSQEVVVKNVGVQVAKVVGIAGATLMGNGDVVLILHLGQLAAQLSDSDQEAAMRAGMAAGLADVPATVMVVDDSVTVRKVTQRFLARESFDVMLAKDGVDALRQLEERLPDVMLVDVEMPRMDGFDLTRALRKAARTKHIPIVMITSRTADKHRNFAMSLGVNEYLGKPYDESRLLELINTYVARQREQQAEQVH